MMKATYFRRILARQCSQSSENVVAAVKKNRHGKNDKFSPQNIYSAVELLKEKAWANFDETVEVAVNLGVDPRKSNQAVKGVARLPHGTGKKVRVGVFAAGADAQAALDAGADVVGGEDLISRVQSGEIPFDRVVATPQLMPAVSKIGKVCSRVSLNRLLG